MSNFLTKNDVDEKLQGALYTQNYQKKKVIDGVKVIPLSNFVGEEGDFGEIFRLSEKGEIAELPGFHIRQISRTSVFPGAIKAWHLHYRQDEVWFVLPTSHMVVGLWDVRAASPTKGVSMRLSLGMGKSYLVYIPRGVAHGCANFSQSNGELVYFMNEQFERENPDEHRLPFMSAGPNFWTPERD